MKPNQLVNDLVWVVNSPSLVRPESIESPLHPRRPLSHGEVDEAKLTRFMADQRSRRVGHYFERLVSYYLVHHVGAQALRQSVQVRDQGRTIGELDFVYRDTESRIVHLETTVKFFLHLPTQDSLDSSYVGPNARDTLERKVERLRDHQLPLSDHPQAQREILAERPEPISKLGWVCGRIFYHPLLDDPKDESPLLSVDHLRGHWIRVSELEWLDREHKQTRFCILQKPYWITGNVDDQQRCSVGVLVNRLHEHFSRGGHPVMINGITNRDMPLPGIASPDALVDLMVVSDAWPLQDNQSSR